MDRRQTGQLKFDIYYLGTISAKKKAFSYPVFAEGLAFKGENTILKEPSLFRLYTLSRLAFQGPLFFATDELRFCSILEQNGL